MNPTDRNTHTSDISKSVGTSSPEFSQKPLDSRGSFLTIQEIVESNNPTKIPGGGGSYSKIPERIAGLSVPAGLVYIPEVSHHKLEYRSDKPYFTYNTIPNKLYDTLIDLVSVNNTPTRKYAKSTSRKIQFNGNKRTRRNT